MSLPPENVLFKVFGIANIFHDSKKCLNYTYRVCFLIFLCYIPKGAIGLQYEAITNGNIVVATKVFIETSTYWLTLYFSYTHLFLQDQKMTYVKTSLRCMERTLKMTTVKRRSLIIGQWVLILSLLTCQISYYTTGTLLTGGSITTSISYFFNKFTVNLINYQLSSLLWVINHQFGVLNDRLEVIGKKMKLGNAHGRKLFFWQKEIRKMRECHIFLTDVCRSLNEAYAVHMWFVVVNNIAEIISSLAGLLFFNEICHDNRKCILMEASTSILWLFNFSIPVTVMVFSCDWVKHQARKTQNHVLDIELESSNGPLILLLENFSMELQLNQFSFTGYGCFKIEKPLLLTNASTAMTYLIMQKQFAFDGLHSSYTGF